MLFLWVCLIGGAITASTWKNIMSDLKNGNQLTSNVVTQSSEEFTVSFSLGTTTAEGTVPTTETVTSGSSFTIPTNRTLYVSGKTLTAWTDGTTTYKIGDKITPTDNVELTPVFTDNTKTLADRTDAVTLLWDFQRKNGAPTMAYQNNAGIYVTQATISGETIDVKMDMDATKGKVNNGNWTDWCQMNNGTKFTIPSCIGAIVSIEAYSDLGADGKTATTIDGQSDYTVGKKITYTVASKNDDIDIVIGNDGSYYRTIQVVLPYIATGGKTYTKEAASVIFPFKGNTTDATTNTPSDAFTQTTLEVGSNLANDAAKSFDNITYTTFKPSAKGSATDDKNAVAFSVVPAKGLTFTPTKVSANIMRFGTDGGQMAVRIKNAEGQTKTLATGIKPKRNKDGNTDKASFEYDVPAEFVSAKGFTLLINIYDNTGKQYGLNNVTITGTVSGTLAEVAKHTITLKASPAEGGEVSVYPNATEFDEGTALKITAKKNFGYKFVNWTDADNNVIATENVANITLNKDMELTANFEKISTYEVNAKVAEPGKSYMLKYSPTPTIVDGKNMYEAGTEVTLTAIENQVIKFTNWSTGETTKELKLTADKDINIEANYTASDFLAGWDFYTKGNNSRKADFASEDNETSTLVMRDADGNIKGWLDKSVEANGGSGDGSAICWQTDGIGKYYWQTTVNASAFCDIKIASQMQYNYNAYQVYDIEYSLNGTDWTKVGSINMNKKAKTWAKSEVTLPEDANNKELVYIRWKADTSSEKYGASSNNDGITLGEIYITGTTQIVDDGKAPTLVSTVPTNNSTNASASGRIVLTFDKKIASKAQVVKFNGTECQLNISGKTAIINYRNLDYNSLYTFTLPANTITDLSGNNVVPDDITISFTTMNRSAVTKAKFDFIVPDNGTLKDAFTAAAKRTDTNKRYRIYVRKGEYKLPADETATKHNDTTNKDYPDPTTYLNTPNVSIIGEDMNATVITNTVPTEEYNNGYGMANVLEGIEQGDVLDIESSATNTYIQGLTFKSAMGDSKGRDIVLNDKSNKTICKDVCLWGFQDTYVSNNSKSRFYFEGGVLRGNTDYLCGKGDVFYNEVTLQMCGTGYLSAPSTPTKYGYIFNECTIKAEKSGIDGNYTLGRPWGNGTPTALFINTKMEAIPTGEGWHEMGTGWPARFAEYNSTNAKGNTVDISNRKKLFASTHENNPVLTAEEASIYTLATVMGGDDDWLPTYYTEQVKKPTNVCFDGKQLTWDDNNQAICWVVFNGSKMIGFTTTNSYELSEEDFNKGTYTVRAANEMGGLSETSEVAEVVQTITAKLSAGGMGTFCATKTVKTPDGLTAYTATVNNNTVTLNKIEDGIIPANNGVVLSGEANATYDMEYATSDKTQLEGNDLKGTLERTLIENDYSFVLVYDNTENVSYFKNFKNGAYIPANKAYLEIPTATQNTMLRVVINNGGATGINNIENNNNDTKPFYTISGQKTTNPQKGIYIHNGKKVIIK